MSAAPRYEFLDHTGDIRIRANGRTLAELFANAGHGMMAYLFGDRLPCDAAAARRTRIELCAPDRDALLVDWLSELLFRAETTPCAFVDFHFERIDETALAAQASWLPAEPVEEIKAVTYNDLRIAQRDGGWRADVVYDV
ncbi:MAG: archease [Gammaproteobacteria bacterium]